MEVELESFQCLVRPAIPWLREGVAPKEGAGGDPKKASTMGTAWAEARSRSHQMGPSRHGGEGVERNPGSYKECSSAALVIDLILQVQSSVCIAALKLGHALRPLVTLDS